MSAYDARPSWITERVLGRLQAGCGNFNPDALAGELGLDVHDLDEYVVEALGFFKRPVALYRPGELH